MYDVLAGIRVVEVAEWTFVPVAGVVLSDWGADVIKIEHPITGDPQRGLTSSIASAELGEGFNAMTEAANRGKRSLGLDLKNSQGRAILDKLVAEADVFLTSLRAPARRKLRIEPADIADVKPDIIYARGTGYGLIGPDADKGGYDWPSAWCRSGIAHRMTPPGGEPPSMPGSIGDITGGITLAGAISAALTRRERTGKGGVVDNNLYSVGAWIMSQSIARSNYGAEHTFVSRSNPRNPIVNTYRTKDDRWICLCLLQADAWWADFCEHIGREDLIHDPRFADMTSRNENRDECIAELDATFAKHTLDEWRARLDTMEGVWSPVLSTDEVIQDPQALVNGIVAPVDIDGKRSYLAATSPGQFDEKPIGALRSAPEAGQHTEEVMLEFGFDWDDILAFKESGAIQ